MGLSEALDDDIITRLNRRILVGYYDKIVRLATADIGQNLTRGCLSLELKVGVGVWAFVFIIYDGGRPATFIVDQKDHDATSHPPI